MAKKLFIAATGQHEGKTTCTLGIVRALTAKGLNVGYCKPVGQKHLLVNGEMADKDALLFEQILKFEVDPIIHSPIVMASGVTTAYIEDPTQFNFMDKLDYAAEQLENTHDVIVYEGTGHVGVGSIADISNAQVAKRLGAEVIMVVGGGIGRTIDKLNLNLALFRELDVPVIGVIVNKVHKNRLSTVETLLRKKLNQMDLKLLGVLPFDKRLSYPILGTVRKAIDANVKFNGHNLDNRIEEVLAGSMIEINEITDFKKKLLIVNHNQYKKAVKKVKLNQKENDFDQPPLSGVIITGDGRHNNWWHESDVVDRYLIENEIPILTTSLDTYDTVMAISRIEVKINTHTPWKIKRAIALIQRYVDIDQLFDEKESKD